MRAAPGRTQRGGSNMIGRMPPQQQAPAPSPQPQLEPALVILDARAVDPAVEELRELQTSVSPSPKLPFPPAKPKVKTRAASSCLTRKPLAQLLKESAPILPPGLHAVIVPNPKEILRKSDAELVAEIVKSLPRLPEPPPRAQPQPTPTFDDETAPIPAQSGSIPSDSVPPVLGPSDSTEALQAALKAAKQGGMQADRGFTKFRQLDTMVVQEIDQPPEELITGVIPLLHLRRLQKIRQHYLDDGAYRPRHHRRYGDPNQPLPPRPPSVPPDYVLHQPSTHPPPPPPPPPGSEAPAPSSAPGPSPRSAGKSAGTAPPNPSPPNATKNPGGSGTRSLLLRIKSLAASAPALPAPNTSPIAPSLPNPPSSARPKPTSAPGEGGTAEGGAGVVDTSMTTNTSRSPPPEVATSPPAAIPPPGSSLPSPPTDKDRDKSGPGSSPADKSTLAGGLFAKWRGVKDGGTTHASRFGSLLAVSAAVRLNSRVQRERERLRRAVRARDDALKKEAEVPLHYGDLGEFEVAALEYAPRPATATTRATTISPPRSPSPVDFLHTFRSPSPEDLASLMNSSDGGRGIRKRGGAAGAGRRPQSARARGRAAQLAAAKANTDRTAKLLSKAAQTQIYSQELSLTMDPTLAQAIMPPSPTPLQLQLMRHQELLPLAASLAFHQSKRGIGSSDQARYLEASRQELLFQSVQMERSLIPFAVVRPRSASPSANGRRPASAGPERSVSASPTGTSDSTSARSRSRSGTPGRPASGASGSIATLASVTATAPPDASASRERSLGALTALSTLLGHPVDATQALPGLSEYHPVDATHTMRVVITPVDATQALPVTETLTRTKPVTHQATPETDTQVAGDAPNALPPALRKRQMDPLDPMMHPHPIEEAEALRYWRARDKRKTQKFHRCRSYPCNIIIIIDWGSSRCTTTTTTTTNSTPPFRVITTPAAPSPSLPPPTGIPIEIAAPVVGDETSLLTASTGGVDIAPPPPVFRPSLSPPPPLTITVDDAGGDQLLLPGHPRPVALSGSFPPAPPISPTALSTTGLPGVVVVVPSVSFAPTGSLSPSPSPSPQPEDGLPVVYTEPEVIKQATADFTWGEIPPTPLLRGYPPAHGDLPPGSVALPPDHAATPPDGGSTEGWDTQTAPPPNRIPHAAVNAHTTPLTPRQLFTPGGRRLEAQAQAAAFLSQRPRTAVGLMREAPPGGMSKSVEWTVRGKVHTGTDPPPGSLTRVTCDWGPTGVPREIRHALTLRPSSAARPQTAKEPGTAGGRIVTRSSAVRPMTAAARPQGGSGLVRRSSAEARREQEAVSHTEGLKQRRKEEEKIRREEDRKQASRMQPFLRYLQEQHRPFPTYMQPVATKNPFLRKMWEDFERGILLQPLEEPKQEDVDAAAMFRS
ncbi:hypothetical protein PAPYR_4061 [Paratrimastix pyriformis]|uniref:Uncharacterized protein n=1 Tax=Paratrimastix pyriformis TaxID=342808 RepID=A0ABQ8UME1_9EUKA|nr:hypothetical protein PAPYR_4061 [Paratrimastix pyriformis]